MHLFSILLLSCRHPVPAVVPVVAPSTPVPMNLPTGADASTPSLFSDGETLLLSWQEPGSVLFSSLEAGQWSAPSTIASGNELVSNWADFPSVVAGGDGTLIAHWLQRLGEDPYAYGIQIGRSADGGQTWTDLGALHTDQSPTEHGFASLLPTDSGVQAFWLDGREMLEGGPMTLRTVAITGEGVGPEAILDARVCDCCGTAAALIDGQPAILYRDRSASEQRDIGFIGMVGAEWSEPEQLADDGWIIPGCPVNGPAMVATDDQTAMAWFTAARQTPQVRVSFDRERPLIVARGGAVIGRVDVLLGLDGVALVSWMVSTGDDATVMIRRVHADGRMGEPMALGLTSSSRSSGFPQLALHGDALIAAWTVPGESSRIQAVQLDPAVIPPLLDAPTTLIASTETTVAHIPDLPPDLDGALFDLDPQRPVLLNLWATWCAPCRGELPDLALLQERHPELQVIALSIDVPEAAEQVREMTEALAAQLTILHGSGDAPAQALDIRVLPTTFLFDASGMLMWSEEGRFDLEDAELLSALEALR